MSRQEITRLVASLAHEEGIRETAVKGVQLFRMTEPVRCAPAIYEPAVVVIVSGAKEAILDGERHVYDSRQYLCCPISMPVEAGAPTASPETPLLGVYLSLDTRVMTELAIEMESAAGLVRKSARGPLPPGLALAHWDAAFSDALLRLLQVAQSPADAAILGEGRLRELYYAVLKGEAGESARRAFGVGNEIARTIDYLSSRLDEPVSIEDMAGRVGMSRAVFHRKFKQATTMSPIQFVKSMRLNTAAMQIANGKTVSEAAMAVGYVSSSQFSREFKRLYGQSPKQWSQFK
ncbi:MAG: AraC family transcriptional regulator [Cobetia sp.]|uniref:AraC family transcriptional regulator n=1 Tax=unclassified Cobetia TaxID=2609414 RepID=UPI000C682530|nr:MULTISPECIES: AraC family transcriptional regulator [unclassified Cobetia]MBR9799347.1 AraC family transcriptional regulator [Gammaproteobacteria bacterium]MBF07839.1 AraC family transcriptional regulator [Cobetia sp.]MBK09379.1 AraC family transcriptional regulator [Cobetia sp.]MDH2297025.1 AraC family transcriptional regulator [Cobetia sp. 29-18-1]HAR07528.1 AraC family transcriptional regulator [Cobetia sp.]|tara:strand:- start:8884 stop:9756 length:873 start_codon:yes stop_codon:yes gene_type:complete